MPRHVLLLLAALVLGLHGLILVGLPLGDQDRGRAQTLAFHTRMVEPPPPAPAPEPAPEVTARPAPPPRPARKPRPRPRPAPPPEAPKPEPEPQPEPQPLPPATAAMAGDASPLEPTDTTADTAEPSPDVAAPDAATAQADAPTPEPAPEPATAAPAAPEAAAPPPADAPPSESAGVEIRPPGAAGAVADTTPPPVRLPPSTRLTFDATGEVKRFHYSAGAELVWRQEGERYEARQQIKAFLLGSRSQTSVGQITPQGLRPERFGDKARSERAAHFDFDRHEVIFSANTPRATIGEGAQDRLSVFIQLGAMLAAAPERYPAGTQITLTTVGPRRADRWTFTVDGPETLELPAGSTPALKLQRVPRADQHYEQKAELWLGTQLGYLPVRIRLSQANGDFVDLQLSGHEPP